MQLLKHHIKYDKNKMFHVKNCQKYYQRIYYK